MKNSAAGEHKMGSLVYSFVELSLQHISMGYENTYDLFRSVRSWKLQAGEQKIIEMVYKWN